jgi:hypothetical protein
VTERDGVSAVTDAERRDSPECARVQFEDGTVELVHDPDCAISDGHAGRAVADRDPLDRSLPVDPQEQIVRRIGDPRHSCAPRDPARLPAGVDDRLDSASPRIDDPDAVRRRLEGRRT